jgi:SAM-dependent methyltransferase
MIAMNPVRSSTSPKSQARSDFMPFLDARTDLFLYFAEALGEFDWSDKDVLDFGGNIGGLLRDPNSTIREERYWCIDIVAEAIEQGKRDYPRAHWLFYDLYNFRFNPYGSKGLDLANLEQQFDIIAAYSVFTSNFEADLLRLVTRLKQMLKPGGQLAFTFMDPDETLQWRLERLYEKGADVDVQAMTRRARGARSCILLNERELYIDTREPPCPSPELQTSCYVFHSAAYMQSLFPRAVILPPPDAAGQHCCVLRSPP